MITNEERERRAARALLAYSDPDDQFISLLDFITDLMRLCRRKDYDFEHALSLAQMHFEAESDEPPTQTIRVTGIIPMEQK